MQRSTSRPDPSIMGLAAEAYADFGWSVFPLHRIVAAHDGNTRCGCGNSYCNDQGKHPAVKWRDASTTQVATIRRWWNARPLSGIGLDCGKSGIYVIDIDPKNGGMESLDLLFREHGEEWAKTPTVRTGSGGFHFYFKNLATNPLHNSVLAKGIDTRGWGGYVVLPPSNHKSGNSYAWGETFDAAYPMLNVPQWVITKLAQKPVWTGNIGQTKIPEGFRNETLTSLAGKMRRVGLPPDVILEALKAVRDRYTENPGTLADAELDKMTRSMQRYTTAEQRKVLEEERQRKLREGFGT